MITDSQIQKMIREKKRREITVDQHTKGSGTLRLIIKPRKDRNKAKKDGMDVSASWQCNWFAGGKRQRYNFASAHGPGSLSLKDARDEFNRLSGWIQEALDPREEDARETREQKAQRETELAKLEQEARQNIHFQKFFDEHYLPQAETSKKPETLRKEKEHVRNWLAPVVGDLPFKEIGLPEVKKIKAKMKKANKSPRSIQYVFQTFSSIWNSAFDEKLTTEKCPTKNGSFRLEKLDNARKRYLSAEESETLLKAVQARNEQAYQMALVALDSGLRFGEIASLRWSQVDLERGLIHVLNTKGKQDRTVPMTQRLKDMISEMDPGKGLIFPNTDGKIQGQIPSAFKRAVVDSGLNDGITDPKEKIGFHGLRHTYASRLIEAGVDLYTVQKLLGHSTPVVTQRYAHLKQDALNGAVQAMQQAEARARQIKNSKGKILELEQATS